MHKQRKLLQVSLFGVVLLGCILNAIYRYFGAGRDDIFITLWAGKMLGTAPWFINYNGELQEISSSILGALIAKFAYLCCADTYYLANKLLGGGAALATLWIIGHGRHAFFGVSPTTSAITATTLLGFNSSFAYWSLSGMETPYYALLVLLHSVLVIRIFSPPKHQTPPQHNYVYLAIVHILAILCRPEGFWLLGITLVLVLAYWPTLADQWLRIFKIALLPPALCLLLLLVIRYAVTGAIFPNPVYAKVSLSHLGSIQEGWDYLSKFYGLGLIGVLLAASTIGAGLLACYAIYCRLLWAKLPHGQLESRLLAPALSICAYDTFILLVKGDWMEYHRFLVPTLGLKVLLLVIAGERLYAMVSTRFPKPAMLAAVLFSSFTIASELSYRSPQDCSARFSSEILAKLLAHPNETTIGLNCAHQRDNNAIRPFIEQELAKYLAQKGTLTIATYQGGFFPYFVREKFSARDIYFVDTTGLLNLEIAKTGGEKIPTGNKHLDDIPAILSGAIPDLSERVSRYQPNMIYMLGDKETDRAQLATLGFARIYEAPGAVVYLKQ